VILTDTGPLVALSDEDDLHHRNCVNLLRQFPEQPLLSTMSCFTEAMYLLHRYGGYPAQATLWELYDAGLLMLHQSGSEELRYMSELMAKYRDLPMDLADASLIAASEALGIRRIFTLDQDFRIYRFVDGSSVEVIP
jgi:uncharacterized protein